MAMEMVLACHQLAARLFGVVVALTMILTVAVAVAMAMAMIFTSMLVWVVRAARLLVVAMPVVMNDDVHRRKHGHQQTNLRSRLLICTDRRASRGESETLGEKKRSISSPSHRLPLSATSCCT